MKHGVLVALSLCTLAATASAQDDAAPPEKQAEVPLRTCVDGRLEDRYWSLSWTLPGLVETGLTPVPEIFRGHAGEMRVEIWVYEYEKILTDVYVRDSCIASWPDEGREMRDITKGDEPVAWFTFVERDMAGLDAHHGYAFHLRGHQIFVVHAYLGTPTATSGESLRKAITSLRLGEDRGGSLAAYLYAREKGVPSDHIKGVIHATRVYSLEIDDGGAGLPSLAAHVMRYAVEHRDVDAMMPVRRFELLQTLALLDLEARRLDLATDLLKRCIAVAPETPSPTQDLGRSYYNLACAHALAGRADAAFEALERSLSVSKTVVDREHLTSDVDLESLHTDARWAPLVKRFWE